MLIHTASAREGTFYLVGKTKKKRENKLRRSGYGGLGCVTGRLSPRRGQSASTWALQSRFPPECCLGGSSISAVGNPACPRCTASPSPWEKLPSASPVLSGARARPTAEGPGRGGPESPPRARSPARRAARPGRSPRAPGSAPPAPPPLPANAWSCRAAPPAGRRAPAAA